MTGDASAALRAPDTAGAVPKSAVTVGFDILELITTGMYLSPLTIYREFIQNSADAVDEAKSLGLMPRSEHGRVDIDIKPDERGIRIRDNGTGIAPQDAPRVLTAIGASSKRREKARGFRGIGRLAGLGYCREIVFRTRNGGGQPVFEMSWNGHALKDSLQRANVAKDLQSVVSEIVRVQTYPSSAHPARFFEVEMRGLVRHGNDVLLDPNAVAEYLAQVAPVPFAPEFLYGQRIVEFLSKHEEQTELHIHICGNESPLFRPHRDSFSSSASTTDQFVDLETQVFEGADGSIAAVGWLLHHGYRGALPVRAGIKGLRARLGNIQVGGTSLFEEAFPEPRFNHWTVGDIHILDRRIIPNGRRDHFEQNIHLRALQNQIAPLARSIAKRCRESSVRRNAVRALERHEREIIERGRLLKLSALSRARTKAVQDAIQGELHGMEAILARKVLGPDDQKRWSKRVLKLNRVMSSAREKKVSKKGQGDLFASLPKAKREAFSEIIDLISECAPNTGAAKALISRILGRIKVT